MKTQKLLAQLCRKAGWDTASWGQIRIMRGSTWHAGAREKQMKQSPNQSACHSPKGAYTSPTSSAHGLFKKQWALASVTGQECLKLISCFSDWVFQLACGTFWQVAVETSGNTGAELMRKCLQCLPSVSSTQELSSCGFVVCGFGGLFFCFFQTLQSLLPDKMSLVLQHKFWYVSV